MSFELISKDLNPIDMSCEKNAYFMSDIVIDRFNPIHLKKILSFCIENINIFLLT